MYKISLFGGSITGLYYLEEISKYSKNIPVFLASYFIVSLHDAVCIFFILTFLHAYHNISFFITLNVLYTFIMFLFSIYKRCVLTLLYNYVLGLPMCVRYIPIWQRIFSQVSSSFCTNDDKYKTTYLWLNDHIFQSGMMLFMNTLWFLRRIKK